MANNVLNWAKSQRVESPIHKTVLLLLSDHADKMGVSWPSVDLLAFEGSTTRRTVQRALRALERAGKIQTLNGMSEGGRGSTTQWRCCLEEKGDVFTPIKRARGRKSDAHKLEEKGATQTNKGVIGADMGVTVTPEPIEPLRTNRRPARPKGATATDPKELGARHENVSGCDCGQCGGGWTLNDDGEAIPCPNALEVVA